MEEIENETKSPKRPIYLTVLCILTFISAGLGCISALMTPLISDFMIEFLKSMPNIDEIAISETTKLLQAGWVYYLTTFLLTLGSLAGAILMWNLKKIGFHFYALSNLALLFVPTIILGIVVSWFGVFIVAGFIALYAVHLKYMS